MTTTSSKPWDSEPNKMTWTDPATGLPCHMVRNLLGAWCGYVGVYEDHPATRIEDAEMGVNDLDVHGGITFHSCCDPNQYPRPKDDKRRIVWFGFDCAHYVDLIPKYPDAGGGVYRDAAFVRAECARLARQLQAYKPPQEEKATAVTTDPLDPSTWEVPDDEDTL